MPNHEIITRNKILIIIFRIIEKKKSSTRQNDRYNIKNTSRPIFLSKIIIFSKVSTNFTDHYTIFINGQKFIKQISLNDKNYTLFEILLPNSTAKIIGALITEHDHLRNSRSNSAASSSKTLIDYPDKNKISSSPQKPNRKKFKLSKIRKGEQVGINKQDPLIG